MEDRNFIIKIKVIDKENPFWKVDKVYSTMLIKSLRPKSKANYLQKV